MKKKVNLIVTPKKWEMAKVVQFAAQSVNLEVFFFTLQRSISLTCTHRNVLIFYPTSILLVYQHINIEYLATKDDNKLN